MKDVTTSPAAPTARLEGQIAALLKALRTQHLEPCAIRLLREMWVAARLRSPGETPRWSGVTDDSTPVEFSIQFHQQGGDFRMLIEPQADPASPEAYWSAGKRFTRWLARRWDAQIATATAIEPLFKPRRGVPTILSMGHGVEVRRGGPVFKVYYNAMAQGADRARDLVAEAFGRLGFARTWSTIERALRPLDRLELLSLDLSDTVRIKLYVRPLEADLGHLIRLYCISEASEPSDVPRIWQAIHPRAAPERMRPVFLTYNVTDPAHRKPSRTSLSIPLFPGVADDAEARRRVSGLMKEFGISPASYRRCVIAMAELPLEREEGIHSYVALQRTASGPAIVTYFNPRLYMRKYGWVARDPVRTWPSGVLDARASLPRRETRASDSTRSSSRSRERTAPRR